MAQTEPERMKMLDEWWASATEGHEDWRNRASESFRFYTGIAQWEPEDLAALAEAGRPALTINHILAFVNMLCGYQRQNRNEIKLFARRGGTVQVASIGSQLIKHTLDLCDGQFALSDMFSDGVVGGKGWVGTDRIYDDDPMHGDLVVRHLSPFEMYEDPTNTEYDINAGRYIFHTQWIERELLELQYPAKAKQLVEGTASPEARGSVRTWIDKIRRFVTGDDYGSETGEGVLSDLEEQRSRRQYEVRECWWKDWQNRTIVVFTPKMMWGVIRSAKQLARVRELMHNHPEETRHLRLIDHNVQTLHRTVSVGEVVLEDVEDPLEGAVRFPFMRFSPYLIEGYVMGVVDNLKDPQREENKNRSQVLHHLNQTANSGYVVGKLDPAYEAYLKQFGSQPGIIVDLGKVGGKFEKIVPSPMDAGHFMLAQQSARDMKEISGINPDMIGTQAEQSESGRARLIRQSAGLTTVEAIFDNFRRTQRSLGSFLWDAIRRTDVYSAEEIVSVIDEPTARGLMRPDPITGALAPDEGAVRSLLRDWSLGRYGVNVGEGQNVPALRMEYFQQVLDAMRGGIPIPPDVLVKLSDWPYKDEVIKRMEQQAAAAQGAPGQAGPGGFPRLARPQASVAAIR